MPESATSPLTPSYGIKSGGWRRAAAGGMAAIYAGMGWLRLYNALRLSDYLAALGAWPGPHYLAISGGLIGLGFTSAALMILAGHTRMILATRLVSLAFLAWLWADRILLNDPLSFLDLLPVSLVISMATLALMFCFIRPATRAGDRENHER